MLSLFSTNDGRLYLPAKTQNWTSSHGIVGSRLTMWPSNVWSLVGKVTPHLSNWALRNFLDHVGFWLHFWMRPCCCRVAFCGRVATKDFPWFFPHFSELINQNKSGGIPRSHCLHPQFCGTRFVLVMQCYAPLALMIFPCISWGQSWIVLGPKYIIKVSLLRTKENNPSGV